jgi:PAS domain-containing protein
LGDLLPSSDSADRRGDEVQSRRTRLHGEVDDANPNVHYCYAGYESGELLINNHEPPEGYDPTARPWYQAAVRSYPELSIGLPYQQILDDEWLISVSQAFRADGAIRGVVAVDSTVAGMSDTMNLVNPFDSQFNFVVDSHGVILVHENFDYIGMTLESVASGTTELFTGQSELVSFTTDHGEEIAYYTRLDTADWILVSAIQRSEVIGPIHLRILLVVVGVVVVSVLMGFMQVMLYERRFVRPLAALRKRVFELTSGRLSRRAIAEQVEAMTEGAQTKRAAELRLILESTSDGIIVLDEDSQVIRYGTRFLDLWGLEHEREIHEMDDEMRRDHDSDEITSDLIFLTNGIVLEQYSCSIVEDEKLRRLATIRSGSFRPRSARCCAQPIP